MPRWLDVPAFCGLLLVSIWIVGPWTPQLLGRELTRRGEARGRAGRRAAGG